MSYNTFEVTFPPDHPTSVLKDVKCRVSALVTSINYKVPKEPENLSEAEIADRARENVRSRMEVAWGEEVDKMILDAVMDQMVDMDTSKVTESVSWVKFGEKSLRAFSWNLVKEEMRGRRASRRGTSRRVCAFCAENVKEEC